MYEKRKGKRRASEPSGNPSQQQLYVTLPALFFRGDRGKQIENDKERGVQRKEKMRQEERKMREGGRDR